MSDIIWLRQTVQRLSTLVLVLTEKATNILRLAVLEARLQHAMQVEPEHLVLAILHDNSGNGAKEVLTLNNISYDDAKRCFEHKHSQMTDGLDLPDEDYASSDGDSRADSSSSATGTDSKTQQNSHSQTPILDRFSTDLTVTALKHLTLIQLVDCFPNSFAPN